MITQPSPTRLLQAIRGHLHTAVAPAIDDRELRVSLEMVDAILGGLIVSSDDRLGWMRDEVDAIVLYAERFPAEDHRVADARDALSAQRAAADGEAATAEYELATELLSRCLESSIAAGGSLAADGRGLLRQRLSKEIVIRGEARLAGRDS